MKELGYYGFEVSDLQAWEKFAVDVVGMTIGRKDEKTLSLRLDEHAYRLVLEQGPADDVTFLGFDCGTDENLDALIQRLQQAGHSVEDRTGELAARRLVNRIAVVEDPLGIRVELFVGPTIAEAPFVSPVTKSGFVTEGLGAGHAVLVGPDRDALVNFYTLLGFEISDYIKQEVAPGVAIEFAFMHCNGRHHTLAFAGAPFPKRIDHFMVEVRDSTDVGLAYDRALDNGVPISRTLGLHPNDRMFSFYAATPSGFSMEYGHGGVEIGPDWEIAHYDHVSVWGHRPPAAEAPSH
ncbi:VOC family protein [Granulicoccus phenolivorans]|uniref:VOC family protein n=1 Tax=Granulicoccus phenolivorans TaxID=266854 RepID=UPI001C3F2A06|nr:VOC family protein [Granulicoccus phenolivorans]